MLISSGASLEPASHYIWVNNTGTTAVATVSVTDVVPLARMVIITAERFSGPPMSCLQMGLDRVSCHFALAPGETASVRVEVALLATLMHGTLVTNCADMTAAGSPALQSCWTTQAVCELTCSQLDLNNDGVIDVFDLSMLMADWGVCGPLSPRECYGCRGDFNGDGRIDIFDASQLLGSWSQRCEGRCPATPAPPGAPSCSAPSQCASGLLCCRGACRSPVF